VDWFTRSQRTRITQIRIGIPICLLLGAYMSVNSRVTDKVSWSRNVEISRSNSPLEFWLVILTVPAITVVGTCLAVRYRQYIWGGWGEELGITRHKVFQYLSLFSVLVVIYWICLSGFLKFFTEAPYGIGLGDLMRPIVKFCLVSVLPFAVLAYCDKTWRTSDAASICLGAWIVVCASFWPKYGDICPFAILLPFFLFILSALLAHSLGRFFTLESTAT